MPRMLFGKVLRSPYAHARVISIDTSAAEALPSVEAVCTFQNTTNKPFNASATMVTTTPGHGTRARSDHLYRRAALYR